MRFILMHKHDPHTEAGELPPPELIQKMGAFIGSHMEKGTFLGGDGLGKSANRSRVTFKGGEAEVLHGPFKGKNELVSAVLSIKVKSREEAIGWAKKYGKILVDGELEVSQCNEPWDIGIMPRPPGELPLRFLLLHKASEATESPAGLATKQKADLTKLRHEMEREGVLVSAVGLAPSSKSKRLFFTDHKLQTVDGPFSESKELIGGYSILEMPSFEAVIEDCKVYAEILGGTLEIDVRPVVDIDAV